MFYLTTHSTHFIYGYMASDIWLRTILIVRKETRCRHIGYTFRLTARVLLYAPSHRQDSTYYGLCYTSAVMNKLHSVKPVLGDWQSSYRRCRKDEVVLCRARIGHTHLTHSYILRKDPPPLCERCQCILTVRHILVECNHFAQVRKDIFGRRNVVESFRFHPTLIVLFLKQIEFYYKFY